MKKIITVFILLLTVSTALFSKESHHIWEDVEYNSISATIDENTLYIYADKQYENLDIQIQDIDGTVVYTNKVNLQAGVEFMISVSDLLGETHQIVLTVGDQTLRL